MSTELERKNKAEDAAEILKRLLGGKFRGIEHGNPEKGEKPEDFVIRTIPGVSRDEFAPVGLGINHLARHRHRNKAERSPDATTDWVVPETTVDIIIANESAPMRAIGSSE